MVFHGRSFLSIITAPDPPLHSFNAPMATALELGELERTTVVALLEISVNVFSSWLLTYGLSPKPPVSISVDISRLLKRLRRSCRTASTDGRKKHSASSPVIVRMPLFIGSTSLFMRRAPILTWHGWDTEPNLRFPDCWKSRKPSATISGASSALMPCALCRRSLR